MTPATLLDSVVFGAVSQAFPDGSPVPDVGMMVPLVDQLDSDSFAVAPATMTTDEGDESLEAVEETVLALMASDLAAVDGWEMTGGQDPCSNFPKVRRDFTTNRFGADSQVAVMAEQRFRHERPHVRPRSSLGTAVTNPITGAHFGCVLRLSRRINGNELVERKIYYTWEEPVTDAMLAGAGVLHGGEQLTAAGLYGLFGPWVDRDQWYGDKTPTSPVAAVFQPLVDAAADPLTAWVRQVKIPDGRQLALGNPERLLNPEGLGFRGEGTGWSGHGEVAGILATRFFYDGGRYVVVLYRDGPSSPQVVKRRIGLIGDIHELGSRRSIRQAVAAAYPGLFATDF